MKKSSVMAKAAMMIGVFAMVATAAADTKLKTRNNMGGMMTMDSTVYIKGARQRQEMQMPMGPSITTIYQCDQKRMIQVNEKANTCYVTPLMDADEAMATATAAASAAAPEKGAAKRKGGVVTFTTTATDTGERDKMMGYTARHVKTTMSSQASADACNPTSMKIETDGWYADFPGAQLGCVRAERGAMSRMAPRAGCEDQVRFKTSGTAARMGYPLKLTTTMAGPNGQPFTMEQAVLEVSNATLEAGIFEMPKGCREVNSYQELVGRPDMGAMIRQGMDPDNPRAQRQAEAAAMAKADPGEKAAAAAKRKASGGMCVAIAPFSGEASAGLSMEELRKKLIVHFERAGVEGVEIEGATDEALMADAKENGCSYMLRTDVAAVKETSGRKMGGFLGKAAGLTVSTKGQGSLNYKLYATGETKPLLDGTAASATGDDAQAVMGNVLQQEEKDVMTEIRKRK